MAEGHRDSQSKKGLTFEEKFDYFNSQIESVTSWILKQMSEGKDDWQMPWHSGIPQAQNPKTGKFYSGNNLMILWKKCLDKDYPKNKWATLHQWRTLKANIKKGEKGTLICIAIPKKKKKNSNKRQLDFFDPIQIKSDNQYFTFKFKYVFNQSQVNGYFGDQPDLFNPIADPYLQIEKMIQNSKAKIRVEGGLAIYYSQIDVIFMPELARFIDSPGYSAKEKYQSTLLHELIHWTGHVNRCDRGMINSFGSKEYAFEELIAELGSAILATHFNQRIYPRQDHSQYLNHWLKVLNNDFSFFSEALELARYSIYWLFKHTGIYPFDLKEQVERKIEPIRLESWVNE